MGFLYRFRVLEKDALSVRLRVWVTSPDVLAWGAKAVPKNVRNIQNTPHFAALLLYEQCRDGDALRVAYRDWLKKCAPGKEPSEADPDFVLLRDVARRAIASLKVEAIANFPAPKSAWQTPATPAAQAKWQAYWREWDASADPPDHFARFELGITLADPKWMPSAWPEGLKGTTAYARS